MSSAAISFYIISAFILTGALLAVTSRKIFRSAVWLLCSLTGIAALYFWMDLQFLAAVQIVVYIGGIVVLIIFSIFLTAHTGADLPGALNSRKLLSALIAVSGFSLVTYVLSVSRMNLASDNFNTDVAAIGRQMLGTGANGFVLPFEAVSILLLGAMIGCIAIALRKKPEET
jgi:NADH-quinone oxidoreductase subunit J